MKTLLSALNALIFVLGLILNFVELNDPDCLELLLLIHLAGLAMMLWASRNYLRTIIIRHAS